ncbi:SDR family NAD(P)-dependent oxidoreductase [Arthrobacter sp. GCM10027362]|uniref:SDR family NAD(P)-dependent oxidoreductase n=1 Tax=Arthrobacter sp. GCM10027362 TaxID=3273379 RepID=UPI003629EFCE
MQLEGKRAIITGAATGIGAVTAQMFAREGAKVVVADINEETGQRTVSEIRNNGGDAHFLRTDVTRESEVEALIRQGAEVLGGLDVLFNNAGAQRSGLVTEFEQAQWDLLMAVNPRSCFFGVKYAVPVLRDHGGGSIINMASLAAVKGGAGLTAYAASKGAIVAFTKALAPELAPAGIRVNCVCPGWIDTPFNQPAIDYMGGREEQERIVKQIVPMGRQGRPEEIAPIVVYLASDGSSYMTGQALVVDGGVY